MSKTMSVAQVAAFYKYADDNQSATPKIYADSSQSPYSKAFSKNQDRIFDHEISAQLASDDLANYDPS